MSFFEFLAGQRLQASRLMDNFRHYSGRGTSILPQDINGNLLTDKSIDVGSNTNQFGKIYCDEVVQSKNAPSGIVAGATFLGNLASLASITFTYIGTTITASKSSHGLVVGDTITFIGQTGNNSVLNGTWIITSVGTGVFQFSILSQPQGALNSATGNPVKIYQSKGDLKIGKRSDGVYIINYPFTPNRFSFNISIKTFNVDSGAAIGYFSSMELVDTVTYPASDSLIYMIYGSQNSNTYAVYNAINASVLITKI